MQAGIYTINSRFLPPPAGRAGAGRVGRGNDIILNFVVAFVLLFFILSPKNLFAQTYIPNGPLLSRTQNPIYLLTLGQEPSKATALPKTRFSTWVDMSYSNIFDVGQHNNDEVYLDMELARLSFNIAYGLGRDMEVGLEVPFLHFNGGYFDAWIQDFHKAFGFPNAGREQVANGAFRYRIIKDGVVLYNLKRQAIGLSDIVFSFKYNFMKETNRRPAFATKFRFKFPTGKLSTGLGSGRIDYSIGWILEKTIKRWHFFLNVDYIVSGENRIFGQLVNSQMLAWLTAVEFSVSHPVSIIAQLQGSTPLLTGIKTDKWDGFPMDLILGVKGTHKDLFWGNDFFWQWSFSEDVAAEGPSVDITTMLVLGVRFD